MYTNIRIDKSFNNLNSFSNEILVTCPYCDKKGYVVTESCQNLHPQWPHNAYKFKCNNCYKPLDNNFWYGPLNVYPFPDRCGGCGDDISHCVQYVIKSHSKLFNIKCKTCGVTKVYNSYCKRNNANNNQAVDPHFGLQLWLQFSVDNDLLLGIQLRTFELSKRIHWRKIKRVNR